MIKRPTLYIAGPYTNPDPVVNTHYAAKAATWVFENTHFVPVLPHVTLLWHAITPRPVDFWYELDLHHMLGCDEVTRLPGASSGADREIEVAIEHGLHVIHFDEMPTGFQQAWLDRS